MLENKIRSLQPLQDEQSVGFIDSTDYFFHFLFIILTHKLCPHKQHKALTVFCSWQIFFWFQIEKRYIEHYQVKGIRLKLVNNDQANSASTQENGFEKILNIDGEVIPCSVPQIEVRFVANQLYS